MADESRWTRKVLERLTPVLEHLVRNALARTAVEPELVRQSRGKTGIGNNADRTSAGQ